ncbi:MAG: hypothetical protein M0Q12_00195 [Synergistaceae bacterium]|nr:hypothetical protein [Synergistaceae bacterium]
MNDFIKLQKTIREQLHALVESPYSPDDHHRLKLLRHRLSVVNRIIEEERRKWNR